MKLVYAGKLNLELEIKRFADNFQYPGFKKIL